MEEVNSLAFLVFRYTKSSNTNEFILEDWLSINADAVVFIDLLDSIPRALKFQSSGYHPRIWSSNPTESSRFFFSTLSEREPQLYKCSRFPLLGDCGLFETVQILHQSNSLWVEFLIRQPKSLEI